MKLLRNVLRRFRPAQAKTLPTKGYVVLVWTNIEGAADESFREVANNKIYLRYSLATLAANELADTHGFAIYSDVAPDDVKQWVSIDTFTVVE